MFFKPLKSLFVLFLFTCLFATFSSVAFAADRYDLSGSCTDSNNWSTTSGGAGGASMPGENDIAIFDANSGNCDMGSINATFGAIDMKAGYTGTLTSTSGTLTLMGISGASQGLTVAGGTFTHNSGTVQFRNGTGGEHVYVNNNVTLNHVIFNSSDNYTINLNAATTTVEGNVTFSGGIATNGTVKVKGGNVSVDAAYSNELMSSTLTLEFTGTAAQDFDLSLDVADTVAGTVWINKTSGTLTQIGNIDVSGANARIKVSGGTFAQGNYNIGVSASDAPKGLTIDGGTWTVGSGTINQRDNGGTSFTASGGTFTAGSGAITVGGDLIISGAAFTSTSGTLVVNDEFTLSSGSFTHNSGTVQLGDGSTGQQTDLDAGTISFNHLIINKPDNHNVTISGTTTATAVGNFTRTAGVLNSGTLTVQGNVTITNTGTAMGTTALTLTGSNTQTFTVSAGSDFDGDLTINKTSGPVNLGAALTLNATNQDLTIKEGTFDISGYALTVNGTSGTWIVEDGGNFQLQGAESITMNSDYPQLDSGSTVTLDGTAGPYTVGDLAYHHLTINGSGAIFGLGAHEAIGGTLTITAGTFDIKGYNFTAATLSNADTFALKGGETTLTITNGWDVDSGTTEYNGTSTSYTGLKAGNSYYHLKLNGTGSTWALTAALNVDGNLTITSGTLSAGDGAETINLAGNWTNNSGFTHASGTVILDGADQTIAGAATTFNNLTKNVTTARTLTFTESVTHVVAGTLTLTGTLGNLLSLRSSVTDAAWGINPQGTRTVEYLDVKDSNNTNSTIVNCWTGCTDSGGTTSWSFAQPSVTFSASSQSSTDETGTMTITVNQSAASGAATSIPFTMTGTATGSGTDYSITSSPVSISAGSTSTTITITVTSDTLDEDNETVIATMGSPTNASQGATTVHTATITDDDSPPTVTISSNTSISETSASATVRATLSTASGKDVTVTYSFSGTATLTSDYTRSATQVTISAGGTTGDITVSAASDSLDENDETVIVDIDTVANGTESGTQQMTVTITDDDDAPTYTLSVNNSAIAEAAGTATVTATLNTASGQDLTVSLAFSGTATVTDDYTRSATTIAISAGSTTGTVTVTGVNDDYDDDAETVLVDGNGGTNVTESGTQQVTITLTDDDTASFTLSTPTNSSQVTEGNVATSAYTIVLATKPTSTVTVTITPNAQCSADASTLTFTDSNWSTTQTLTVSSVDDAIDDGTQNCPVAYAVSSSDSNYNSFAITSTTISVVDNDSAGVTVTQSGGTTTPAEGGTTDSYTIVLTSEPTASVTISVGTSTQCSLSAASVAFSTSNWNTTQTVTVTAADDDVAEGSHACTLSHTAASSDSGYNGLSVVSVSATISDNDTAGVTVTISGDSTSVSTSGTTDTYTLVLTSEPTTSVTLTITEGTDLLTDADSVEFTTDNWDVEQTITVAAVEIASYSGAESGTIAHASSSSDPAYQSLTISSVTVTITDDAEVSDVVDVVVPADSTITVTSERHNEETTGTTSSGVRITVTEEEIEDRGTVTKLTLTNNIIFYGLSNVSLKVLTYNNIVFIADATANNNQGIVWRVDTTTASSPVYGWEEDLTGVTTLEGGAEEHLFGKKIELCETSEGALLAIHSPGFGIVDVVSFDFSEAISRIIETTDEFSNSIFMTYKKNITGDNDCDVLTGPQVTTQDVALSLTLGISLDVLDLRPSTSETANGKGFVVAGDFLASNTVDLVGDALSRITTNDGLYSSASGDINGDTINDMIITSIDACEAYVFYGDAGLPRNLERADADIIIDGDECSNFFGYTTAIGEVNGDEYDDIILVALSGGNNQEGKIYVFLGGRELSATLAISDAIVISGTKVSGLLGKEIWLTDTDGDGTLEIVATETVDGVDTTVVLSVSGSISSGVDGVASHVLSCALNTNPQRHPNLTWFSIGIFILAMGILFQKISSSEDSGGE